MWRLGLEVRLGGLVGRVGWEVRFGWCSYAGEVQLCRRRGFCLGSLGVVWQHVSCSQLTLTFDCWDSPATSGVRPG